MALSKTLAPTGIRKGIESLEGEPLTVEGLAYPWNPERN